MFFLVTLYIALAIFGLGLVYKIYTWLSYSIGREARNIPASERLSGAVNGIISTIFSPKILTLLKSLALDVILQRRILREDFLRWLMHMLIFSGFMLLLLMHALSNFITLPLFPDYASTLNPFSFLRNLFFALVIVGLAIAVYRRLILKISRLKTTAMDHYAIIILAVIMVSGVFLEGTKMLSYTSYQTMVEDYADTDEEEELKPKKILSEGEIPSPVNIPPGCSFHQRCPKRMDICSVEDPQITQQGTDHEVRCHLYS